MKLQNWLGCELISVISFWKSCAAGFPTIFYHMWFSLGSKWEWEQLPQWRETDIVVSSKSTFIPSLLLSSFWMLYKMQRGRPIAVWNYDWLNYICIVSLIIDYHKNFVKTMSTLQVSLISSRHTYSNMTL